MTKNKQVHLIAEERKVTSVNSKKKTMPTTNPSRGKVLPKREGCENSEYFARPLKRELVLSGGKVKYCGVVEGLYI